MMRLSEYTFRKLVTIVPDDSVQQAAVKMDSERVGSILVTSNGKVLGIVTRSDFIHNVIVGGRDPKKTAVRAIMNPSPISIDSSATTTEALRKMLEKRVERLVVFSGDRIIGIVSLEDVIVNSELDTLKTLLKERFDEILRKVNTLTPNLVSRYSGDESVQLQRDMNDFVKALLLLLEEAEISLRK